MLRITRERLTKIPALRVRKRRPVSYGGYVKILWTSLLAGTLLLSACGGGSSTSSQQSAMLSGNWQFAMTTSDPNYPASAQYGLQGGFLLENNGSVTGQVVYSIASDQTQLVCNSGSATITQGTISGQTVTLTVVTGTPSNNTTFTLTGTLSSTANGPAISGIASQSSATVVTPSGSTPCGTAQTALSWSAVSVPPLTGSLTGSFHSLFAYNNQDFPVTGIFAQGENIGASSATVTGSLSFIDPVTLQSDYPCFSGGSVLVNGQISGDTIILQLIGTDGSTDGQIGIPASQVPNSENLDQVTFLSTSSGYYLHSAGVGYQVTTKSCKGGDIGYICLALNNSTACQQPITLSPAVLSFPSQFLVCAAQDCPPAGLGAPTTQTITLTNNQPPGAPPLTGLTLSFGPTGGDQSDFTFINNFSDTLADNCSDFLNSSTSGQSCNITVAFAPQESCTWIPGAPSGGINTVADDCPFPLTAQLTVTTLTSSDNDTSFVVPITGIGASYIQSSTPEIDFGAEAIGEASPPQLLSFTNHSPYSVQIVGPRSSPCLPSSTPVPLTRPVANDGAQAGLQVVIGAQLNSSTVLYQCDADPTTGLPNFQISSDTCTGANLAPLASCSLQIQFIPQPEYLLLGSGLDYLLQLNTVQCASQGGGAGSDCEIDSGRFPVELIANPFSPLRMLPAAGLNFGAVTSGKSSVAQTITLSNDPADPNSATVNLISKIAVAKGSYTEGDDCPFSLAPGASCTVTVTFNPSGKGFNQGQLNIVYTLGSANTLGNTQKVYLRGTGQ
jgi:hypothetical protein